MRARAAADDAKSQLKARKRRRRKSKAADDGGSLPISAVQSEWYLILPRGWGGGIAGFILVRLLCMFFLAI